MKKILVTGGDSRFSTELKKINTGYNFVYKNKKQLNILNNLSIKKNIKKIKPAYILHLAGLSRPLSQHNTNISHSINLNIVGTANLVNACYENKIKLIYFSTSYVYPGKKGNYKETDPVLPWSNYAWSKLGGECAVQMYKNSLILRVCMTEKPFIHKRAYSNVKTNFIYHNELALILIKLINKKGIFNIGGKSQTIYNFAKKFNQSVKKKNSKGEFPLKQDMSLTKINKIIKKK
jgi:dTDP-4-dehydrorhamnose reductase